MCELPYKSKCDVFHLNYIFLLLRPYDLMCELPNNARTLHDQVSRLVFLTYVRMATYKESKVSLYTFLTTYLEVES